MPNKNNLIPGAKNPFSKENQPSPEAKSRGKKKAALLRNVAKQLVGPGLKSDLKPIANYLGIEIEDIDLELAMHMMQMKKALKENDTIAYNAVMNRILGKAKEDVTVTSKNNSIDINIINGRKKK